jgi:eukaryotic-like serine/threonine-protein kinase
VTDTVEGREGETGEQELVCPACGRESAFGARFCAACGFRFGQGEGEAADARDVADPLIDRVIADRYRIVELIGRGGMGVVYRVEHTRIGKQMAMKLLHGELARDKEVIRRFRREAEAVSKLDHANTVQVFDFGRSEGMTYLIMELLSGKDLGTILAADGSMPFARMAAIAVQICGSVQQAHERGIVHRDIKPENVRILSDRSEPDFVKVLDFGLAKLRESEEQSRASITREGFLVGTPYYMAPEHIRGDSVDARSDVYALGALMYKALTGVPPFWATSPVAVLTKHLHDPIVPPSVRAPNKAVAEAADRIIVRTLQKDPADRFQSMRELREALAEHLQEIGLDPGSGRLTLPANVAHRTDSGTEVKLATRGDVDRYERSLRYAMYASRALLAVGVIVGGAGLGWLFSGRAVIARDAWEREPNDAPDEATPLPRGIDYSGHIGARHDSTTGDADIYVLENPGGEPRTLSFAVSGLPNMDVLVELYRRDRSAPLIVVDAGGTGQPEGVPNFPFEGSSLLLRVRERWEDVTFPTENVSDVYTIHWDFHERAEGEEQEVNDDETRAREISIGETATGYVGWNGDRDVYCLAEAVPGVSLEASGPGLDLTLTVSEPVTDREHVRSEHGEGEPERWHSPGPVAAGTCVAVTGALGVERHLDESAYTLRVRSAL